MGEPNGAGPPAPGVPIEPTELPPMVYVPARRVEPGDTEVNVEPDT